MKKILLVSTGLGICLLGAAAYYFWKNDSQISENTQAVYATQHLRIALDAYKKDHNGSYPTISSCASITTQKDLLPYFQISEVFSTLEDIGAKIGVSDDKTQFVIQIPELNQVKENLFTVNILDQDIDGIIFGCSCDDPTYCVGN